MSSAATIVYRKWGRGRVWPRCRTGCAAVSGTRPAAWCFGRFAILQAAPFIRLSGPFGAAVVSGLPSRSPSVSSAGSQSADVLREIG